MGLKNVLQFIAEGKFPGGQAIGKKEDIRKPNNNSGIGKIDYSSANNYDSRKYMYGNGSSTSKKTTLNEQIVFGNGSSSSPKPEPTHYIGGDDDPVTHGPTDVIGETDNTPKPDPEVIIPENVNQSDDGNNGAENTTIINPDPVLPETESLVGESTPEDYSNTGAETGEDTWTIVTVPEEPSVVDTPTEPSDNVGSNHGLPENYLDGYSDNPLTASAGRIEFNGHEETYYNLDMSLRVSQMRELGFSESEYPYEIRGDGVKTLGGYVMVAADFGLHPMGSFVETSLGPGIVVDTGEFSKENQTQLDICVTW